MNPPTSVDDPGSKRTLANSVQQSRQRVLDVLFGYDLGSLSDRLSVESRAAGRKYERVFRAADASSLIINLLEPVRY